MAVEGIGDFDPSEGSALGGVSERSGGVAGIDSDFYTEAPKVKPMRGWEFDLVTGEGQKGLTFGELFDVTPESEREFRANIYAATRTVMDYVPYLAYMAPSRRDEFWEKSTGDQTKELLWEALSIVPYAGVGKGIKITAKAVGLPFKALNKVLPFSGRKVISETGGWLDAFKMRVKPFERTTPLEELTRKYKITTEEAEAVLEGRPFLWNQAGRSGGLYVSEGSKNFKKMFTQKGAVSKEVKDKIADWSRPMKDRELSYYKEMWNVERKRIFDDRFTIDQVFKSQAARYFDEADVAKITFKDVDTLTMKRFITDLLESKPSKLFKEMDIGYGHLMPYHFLPVRKVLGFGERVWKTFSNLYVPIGRIFGQANTYSFVKTADFQSILQWRGLGKLKRLATGEYKWKANYSKAEWEEAGKLVRAMDTATAQGAKKEAIQSLMDAKSETVQTIAKSWFDFADNLYADYMKQKLWQSFEKAGLTQAGRDGLTVMMRGKQGIEQLIDATFSVGANLPYPDKAKIVKAILTRAQRAISKENLSWFTDKPIARMAKAEKDALAERLRLLKTELIPMKKGGREGFVNYTDNYVARIREKGGRMSKERTGLLGTERMAAFRKERKLEEPLDDVTEDLGKIIEGRIRMQAKELYVYPELPKIIDFAKRLPDKYRHYSEHYIARMLGEPSNADIALAQWLTTRNRFAKEAMTPRDVMNLAWKINDLVYMGGIGFKPFSAIRNLFQPLLMVPADMGGIKDLYWLGRGYAKMMNPQTRAYIRSIGAIQEYAPEIYLKPRVANFGATIKVGEKRVDLPSTKTVRDVSMWLFKQSDRWNRYLTGAAAMAKWEKTAAKYLPKGVEKFTKKLNLNSRESWIRAEINSHLRRGTASGVEEAKKLWVNDVIADTQFLYGVKDAPIFTQQMGALGRVGGIFQSWWMNYGSALEKWMFRTPDKPPVVNGRSLQWILSGAIAEELMSPLFGQSTAKKTVFFGPFPVAFNEFMIPPTFAPFYQAFHTLLSGAAYLSQWEDDPAKFKRRLKAFGRSSMMFVPGGLQIMQSFRGARQEGWEGLAKSFVRLKGEPGVYTEKFLD